MNCGIGDIVLLSQFAWNVFQGARKACGEHDEFTRETRSLHKVIARLEEELSNPESLLYKAERKRKKDLRRHIKDCQSLLGAIDCTLKKYNTLGKGKEKKMSQRIRFGIGEAKDLSEIRNKMAVHTCGITMELNLLSLGSQGKVEIALSKQGGKLRGIHRSINTIAAKLASRVEEGSIWTEYTEDDKTFWRELRRELHKVGFPKHAVKENKKLIKAYIREIGERGVFDQLLDDKDGDDDDDDDGEDDDGDDGDEEKGDEDEEDGCDKSENDGNDQSTTYNSPLETPECPKRDFVSDEEVARHEAWLNDIVDESPPSTQHLAADNPVFVEPEGIVEDSAGKEPRTVLDPSTSSIGKECESSTSPMAPRSRSGSGAWGSRVKVENDEAISRPEPGTTQYPDVSAAPVAASNYFCAQWAYSGISIDRDTGKRSYVAESPSYDAFSNSSWYMSKDSIQELYRNGQKTSRYQTRKKTPAQPEKKVPGQTSREQTWSQPLPPLLRNVRSQAYGRQIRVEPSTVIGVNCFELEA